MITVVIPTLWKANTFEQQLNNLCSSNYIDEIILINNNKDNTPNYKILDNKKILHIKCDKNIIVNPAWNLGVILSKNNNICLLNDDIVFDINVFEFMSKNKDKTLCGISMYNMQGELKLVPADIRTHGFGCMMFIRKDCYNIIPDSLLYLYGDDYLFIMNKRKGNHNYYIHGCENNQVWGVSGGNGISTDAKTINIINQEKFVFEKIMELT
jgi:hypothetical protein